MRLTDGHGVCHLADKCRLGRRVFPFVFVTGSLWRPKEKEKVFKRILLSLTFVAALCVAGGMAGTSEAHGYGRGNCVFDGYRGGYATYYGYRNYYGGFPPIYPSYYGAGYTYAAPVVVYPGRHHGRHGHGHDHHHHHDRGGVSFSIGF
jgi:hypothetical protein